MFWNALLAFLVLPGMVAFVVPWLLRPRGTETHAMGMPVLAAGIILLLWCVRDFYVSGRGTLAPWAPPKRLVVAGLYRFSRNPMYLAVLTILCGWALLFASRTLWIYAAVTALAFHLGVLLGEEPWLARTHGAEWTAYRSRVPRWLFLLVLACAAPASAQTASCRLPATDSAWIASSLTGWTRNAARHAGARVERAPVLVFFDTSCTHTLTPIERRTARADLAAAGLRFSVASTVHGDSIALPNGTRIPAGLTSFASPQPDGRMFFVMSLPSIWMNSGRGPRADLLATAVFMHEFTHTQTVALSARVDSLVMRGLPEDTDDDVIQARFSGAPGHVAAYEMERDTLFAAASARTRARAKALAASAMRMIDRRRATWFTGADSVFAEPEDVFLSLEGTGQYLAYRWLIDPLGGGMTKAEGLPFMRRGGRHWSQDEGLALLLTAERLSANAPRELFGKHPRTILAVLAARTMPTAHRR